MYASYETLGEDERGSWSALIFTEKGMYSLGC